MVEEQAKVVREQQRQMDSQRARIEQLLALVKKHGELKEEGYVLACEYMRVRFLFVVYFVLCVCAC